ncbi:carbohydrate kinase family protein [Singulisphaera sp. GP187]|uniref:carbohydrate kinase family protein n=1 Tax=Singulisphaera sp. GP187 TaxID=1882752 RepID=UPI0013565E4C|nr:carbohydrate kinase family protein [Singulisphaera sp. GP187]
MSDVSGEPQKQWAGGTCGNVLIALAYLGWEAKPVARLRTGNAADRILLDLKEWGVSGEFVSVARDGSTPVIFERITRGSGDIPRHSFSWRCPDCGIQFPGFKSVLSSVAEEIAQKSGPVQVFFFDRATPASIILAKSCADRGGLVVFEPSSVGNALHFRQAWETAHIVKYSHERLRELPEVNVARSPLLQIETLGEAGLRYRKVLRNGRSGEWIRMEAFRVDVVRDTAGSGDWCTAGIIDCCGHSGAAGFIELKKDELESSIRYGQALAAWNCGFEGARGGMYAIDRETFLQQVSHIFEGGSGLVSDSVAFRGRGNTFVGGLCPACEEADIGKSVTGTDGSTSH